MPEKGQPEAVKLEPFPTKIYNKLEDNWHLTNKKALFLNMRNYYEAVGEKPFDSLPMTFHVTAGLEDPEFLKFKEHYDQAQVDKHNIWIIKPGEYTNQGLGITVSKEFGEI